LASLCQAYWRPVYAHMRRKGFSTAEAQDLTQEFFARLIEKEFVRNAGPERGRFRTFLLVAVQRFLVNDYHHRRALKRGGNYRIESIEFENEETNYRNEPSHTLTPETAFDRQWALSLLDRTLKRFRSEQENPNIDRFIPYMTGEADRGGYEILAIELGTSEGAVKVMIHRLRKAYRAALRAEIAETVASAEEIDSELKHLLIVLRS
jgi:RNA polymerase sigma factor (sigma-70 family)